mmetsp:Transcript_7296/g.22970  ORF Transcript_7296/g.22970 Transcript_7296/m.22970 type:complete len:449 (-) Transcript_7296:21-1367(-)
MPRKGTLLRSFTVPGSTRSSHVRPCWLWAVEPARLWMPTISERPWAKTCSRGVGRTLTWPMHLKDTDRCAWSMTMSRSKVTLISVAARSSEPVVGVKLWTTGGSQCCCSTQALQEAPGLLEPASKHLLLPSSQRQLLSEAAQAHAANRTSQLAAGQCGCVLHSSHGTPAPPGSETQRLMVYWSSTQEQLIKSAHAQASVAAWQRACACSSLQVGATVTTDGFSVARGRCVVGLKVTVGRSRGRRTLMLTTSGSLKSALQPKGSTCLVGSWLCMAIMRLFMNSSSPVRIALIVGTLAPMEGSTWYLNSTFCIGMTPSPELRTWKLPRMECRTCCGGTFTTSASEVFTQRPISLTTPMGTLPVSTMIPTTTSSRLTFDLCPSAVKTGSPCNRLSAAASPSLVAAAVSPRIAPRAASIPHASAEPARPRGARQLTSHASPWEPASASASAS